MGRIESFKPRPVYFTSGSFSIQNTLSGVSMTPRAMAGGARRVGSAPNVVGPLLHLRPQPGGASRWPPSRSRSRAQQLQQLQQRAAAATAAAPTEHRWTPAASTQPQSTAEC
jgi:hypothetical protein